MNNNLDVQENNAFAMADNNFNGEGNNDSDRFVDEEKAFNEWLESCEQTNSIVMNRPFFKLLNLFTEACSVVNDELDYKPLNLYNTDGLNKSKDDANKILITINDHHSKEITNYVNGEQKLHKYAEDSSRSNYDSIQQRPSIVNKIDFAVEHFFNVDVENTYSEDLFKSQKSDKHINNHNAEELAAELFNSDNLIRPIDEQQKSPVICSGRYLLNTTEPDKNKYSKKIDFNELFISHKVNKHIQGYTKEIPDSRKRRLSNGSNKSQSDVAGIDSSMHFDSDGSVENVNIVERNNGDNGSDGEIEYDEAMGNINFEDLFKSQRVDAYIKKYNDSIFVGDQCGDDRNDAIGTIDTLQKSPIVCSGRQKSVSTVDCKSDCDILTGKSDQSIISIIDLVDKEDQENGEKSVVFGRDCWWKSRRENENIASRYGTGQQDVDPAVDDDVISVSGSPEFFSCKLPKKIIQTKIITSRVQPTDEIIDLSTPPSRSSDCVVGPSMANYYTLSPNKNDSAVSKDVGPSTVDEGLPWNDKDDDMDFMFVDYCSGTGTDGNTALSDKNERISDICNEVFTQKPRTDDDVSTDNVFTQKERVDGVNDLKTMTDKSPKCRTPEDGIATVQTTEKPCRKGDNAAAKSVVPSQSYSNGVRSFDFMKTCNLFKPGFSLKRNTASTVRRSTDDKLPVNSPGWRHKPPNFSQSTPKVPTAAAVTAKTKQHREIAEKVNVLFLTSSSDSDVFVEEKPTKSRQRIRKKRPPKPKKVSIPHRGNV